MRSIRILRATEGVSQAQFAKKCGISKSSISLYENGLRKPTADTLLKISKAFNVSVDALLREI